MSQIFRVLKPADRNVGPAISSIINVDPKMIYYIGVASLLCFLPFAGVIPVGYTAAYLVACWVGMAITIDAWSYSILQVSMKQLQEWLDLSERWPYIPKDFIEETGAALDSFMAIWANRKLLRATMTLWLVVFYRHYKLTKFYDRLIAYKPVLLNSEATTLAGDIKADHSHGTMEIDLERGPSM